MSIDPEHLLLESLRPVIQATSPYDVVKNYMPAPPKGRLFVVGAGKASAAMAAAFENAYEGKMEGVVVTRYGHAVPTRHIKILEAAHPVPDEAGANAVTEILQLLETAGADDLVVCLISGGGSALLSAPVEGLEMAEIQELNKALLKSGAGIHEINTVRKHLNKALGGGLAKAAYPAKLVTLAISDVVGDDPATIASGASVADPTSLEDASGVLKKYNIEVPPSIIAALENPENETPKPDDKLFEHHEYHLIATPRMALEAAAAFWEEHGFSTYVWDEGVEGDTNEAALAHVDFIKRVKEGCEDIKPPCAILSGGETTVKVTGSGQGGPNTQFLLQAAIALRGLGDVYAMACDTDGIDGSADNAGAFIAPDTLEKADNAGINPAKYLTDNNSYGFFDTLGQLVKTGPTYTNVNDYRVFLLLS